MEVIEKLFKKSEEVYEAARKIAWKVVAIASYVWFAKWFLFTWLPERAKQFVAWVIGMLPNVGINLTGVSIPWDRINQWVPVNEIIGFLIVYVKLACAIAFLKWVKKFTFW
ncbi:MAG: hypothetical protein EOP83_24045 [Verrucomicrobiaceae bacterium]|nr:MAG: hypothetical protein EOP83_24045 [Verrucomicrobiaceae bacterium]